MGSLVGVRGCEKEEAKGCAGRAGEAEQPVKPQVEILHSSRACIRAVAAGSLVQERTGCCLRMLSVWMLEAWRRRWVGEGGT